MVRQIVCAAVLSLFSINAASALACLPEDEQTAGAESARLAKQAVAGVMPVEGRQMVNVTSCDVRGTQIKVDFRYNYMSGGAYYWLEGRAELDGANGVLKVKKLSDNLETANSAKGGQLLASR